MSFASSTQPQVAALSGGRDILASSLGNYFVASTPTPGTGVVSGNPTTLVATTPYLVLYNGGTADVHLAYLRLLSTVVGGGAATKNFTHFIDSGNRYASGGTALTVKSANATNTTTSSVVGTVGVVTATAASNQRQIGNDWFRVALADVVGDVYEWDFGGRASSTGSTPSTVAHFVHQMPPVVLPPNSSYVLNIWSGTFTQGITFEVSLGFIEK
jgi:hypothetical protein